MTYRVKLFRGEELVFIAESQDLSHVVNALSVHGRSSPVQTSWFLDTPPNPIRTVRRLEPGVYGPLKVGVETNFPDCYHPDEPFQGEVEAHLIRSALNASDWRELARVALEIAEYLEDVD